MPDLDLGLLVGSATQQSAIDNLESRGIARSLTFREECEVSGRLLERGGNAPSREMIAQAEKVARSFSLDRMRLTGWPGINPRP